MAEPQTGQVVIPTQQAIPGNVPGESNPQTRLAYLTVWLRRWAPELESRASEAEPRPEGYERFIERNAEYMRLVRRFGES